MRRDVAIVPREPAAPSQAEVGRYTMTPCSGFGACTRLPPEEEGGTRESRVPGIVFDSAAWGQRGGNPGPSCPDQMLFAHVAPREGLAHEHGSQELIKDSQKLGDQELILKCGRELVLRSAQEEAKRRGEAPTLLDDSGCWAQPGHLSGREGGTGVWSKCGRCDRDLGRAWGSTAEAPIQSCGGWRSLPPMSSPSTKLEPTGVPPMRGSRGRHALMRWWSLVRNTHYTYPKGTQIEDKLEGTWGEGSSLGQCSRAGGGTSEES